MITPFINRVKLFSHRTPSWVLVLLVVTGALLAVFDDELWVKIIACTLTILAGVVQYLQSQTYVYTFESSDWFDRANGEFGLTVPCFRHGKGDAPQIAVYEKQLNGRYSEVVCEVQTSGSGDVIVIASQAIEGQVRVR